MLHLWCSSISNYLRSALTHALSEPSPTPSGPSECTASSLYRFGDLLVRPRLEAVSHVAFFVLTLQRDTKLDNCPKTPLDSMF